MDKEKKRKKELVVLEKNKKEKDCKCEKYFFNYAFPCAQIKVKLHSLRPEEYNILRNMFFENKCPSKEELEKVFQAAFRRLNKLAEELGKQVWDMETLKQYWEINHNQVIDQGEGMYDIASSEFKDLCKIHIAEIIHKKDNKLIVKYSDRTRAVFSFLVPDAKVGEKVRIHFDYAVEEV